MVWKFCGKAQFPHIATGLSDFHKLALIVPKTSFSKNRPKEISYRDYKNLIQISFSKLIIDTCDKFGKVFLEILNKHAKKKNRNYLAQIIIQMFQKFSRKL